MGKKYADLISQAEAAKVRGVTRAAIAYLIKHDRIKGVEVGGRTLVYRQDVESFEPTPAGRPKGSKNKPKDAAA